MNKLSNNQGSSLLTVMIIITLITLLSVNVWRITVIACDISVKKQQHEQQFQIMQAVMRWALDACQNNFDTLYNKAQAQKHGVHLELPQLSSNNTLYSIDLFFKHHKENILSITEHLSIKNVRSAFLSCYVAKEYTQDSVSYRVSDWNSHAL